MATAPAPLSNRRALALLFLFLAALYLVTGKGLSDLLDAEAIYLVTESMVERGWIDLPPAGGLTANVHADGHSFLGPDGRVYSQYWPGYALVQVPCYLLGQGAAALAATFSPRLGAAADLAPRVAINLSLALTTAALATLLAATLLLWGIPRRHALLSALLFGLGTVAWPYAKIGFYEPFLGLCLLLTLYALALYFARRGSLGWLLLAGFAFGWAVLTKPTAALAFPGFLVYYFWRRRRRLCAAPGDSRPLLAELAAGLLGLLPWLTLALWYNWARSGDPLNPGYASWNYELSFTPTRFLSLLAAYLVGPGRSYLFFSPAVLVALLGLRGAWRARPAETALVGLVFLAYWLFHSARVATDPWAWGPRYLVPTVPLVMLLAPWGLQVLERTRLRRKLLESLVVLAILVQLLAVIVPYGAWLHRVSDHTGSSAAVIWDGRWWPLRGQVETLQQVEATPLRLPPSGAPSAEFKWHLRHSLDFWWYYAWRLGLPGGLLAVPAFLLLALAGLSLPLLLRDLRPASLPRPSLPPGSLPPQPPPRSR